MYFSKLMQLKHSVDNFIQQASYNRPLYYKQFALYMINRFKNKQACAKALGLVRSTKLLFILTQT